MKGRVGVLSPIKQKKTGSHDPVFLIYVETVIWQLSLLFSFHRTRWRRT